MDPEKVGVREHEGLWFAIKEGEDIEAVTELRDGRPTKEKAEEDAQEIRDILADIKEPDREGAEHCKSCECKTCNHKSPWVHKLDKEPAFRGSCPCWYCKFVRKYATHEAKNR